MNDTSGKPRAKVLTPAETLGVIRGMVQLVAAQASEQLRWARENRYPLEEIRLQLDDAIPAWLPRLRGVLTSELEGKLMTHVDLLRSLPVEMWLEPQVASGGEWDELRQVFAELAEELVLVEEGARFGGRPPESERPAVDRDRRP